MTAEIQSQIRDLRDAVRESKSRQTSTITIDGREYEITGKPVRLGSSTEVSVKLTPLGSRECATELAGQKYKFIYHQGFGIEDHINSITEKIRSLKLLTAGITTPQQYASGEHVTKAVPNSGQVVAAMHNLDAFTALQKHKSDIISDAASGYHKIVRDTIAKIPVFAALFSGSPVLAHAKPGDPETVGEHTERVLNQFSSQRKFFNLESVADSVKKMPGFEHFNVNAFMTVLLTLHDIGKSLGKDANDQHEFTVPILREAMSALGFSEMEVELAEQLVDNDILGDLQRKPDVTAEQALEQLRGRAAAAKIPVDAFFLLQQALYISDASSYPAVRNSAMWVHPRVGRLSFHQDKLMGIDRLLTQSAAASEIAKCAPTQQQFIRMYMHQMEEAGDRPEWIWTVAHDMAKLYQAGFEKTLLSPDGKRYKVEKSDDFLESSKWVSWRVRAETHLQDLMRKAGGSLKLVHDWQADQVRDSFSPFSCAMKYEMIKSRVDMDDAWGPQERYFLRGHNRDTLRAWHGWTKYQYGCGDRVMQRSLSMNKAATAIMLNAIDHPLINRDTGTCRVVRGLIQGNMPEVFQNAKVGDVITDQPNGIAESTSLHTVGPEFFSEPKYGRMVIQMDVPFARIATAFFGSTEFADRNVHRYMREVVADISNLPMTVTSVSVPQDEVQSWPAPVFGTPLGLRRNTGRTTPPPPRLGEY
jgi:hypothetical protein